MKTNKKVLRRKRIKSGIRKRIAGTPQSPRLCVYRSNSEIYAQIIDDTSSVTLVAASSREKEVSSLKVTRVEKSKLVGKRIAEKAKKAGIETVVFDRNGFLYHGRVKSLAEGAREEGLKF